MILFLRPSWSSQKRFLGCLAATSSKLVSPADREGREGEDCLLPLSYKGLQSADMIASEDCREIEAAIEVETKSIKKPFASP